MLAVIAGFLALDCFSGLTGQFVLGAATWLVLIASCAPLGADQRAKVARYLKPSGNREFVLRDPDGYKLLFFQKKR